MTNRQREWLVVQFQNCSLSVTKLPQNFAMIEEDRRMEFAT